MVANRSAMAHQTACLSHQSILGISCRRASNECEAMSHSFFVADLTWWSNIITGSGIRLEPHHAATQITRLKLISCCSCFIFNILTLEVGWPHLGYALRWQRDAVSEFLLRIKRNRIIRISLGTLNSAVYGRLWYLDAQAVTIRRNMQMEVLAI